MPAPTRRSPRRTTLLGALVALLVAGTLTSVATPSVAADETRTWVVDAIDDEWGNRWESQDTGTEVVTIRAGDTVEWRFDLAGQGHDLTSENTSATWSPPLQEYAGPGDPPIGYTFTEPGVYDYLCAMHGTLMRGTVVVLGEDDNQPPTADPEVDPRTGEAPLVVHFNADASDPDGDEVGLVWDFGTGDEADRATTDHAMFSYDEPGSYTATLTVSDGRGGTFSDEFEITVGEDSGGPGPGDPGDLTLPEIGATAAPASGTSPLTVAFSTEVRTGGEFTPYADGLDPYPDLTGEAVMVRSRGETYTSLDVTGLAPEAAHLVHVHEEACASAQGGAHFRFDETQPFVEENEIWLPFTSDSEGATGLVVDESPQRAGSKAVSIVIHDPDNSARRIGCADLAPSTADLHHQWDFGDGGTGHGADPDHTYAAPGTYIATVTVSRGEESVSASVRVVVSATPDLTPPDTVISGGPTGTVRPRRARFGLTSTEAGSRFQCSLDGRPWAGCASGVTFRALRDGAHILRVRAIDAAGNVDPTPAVRRWVVDRTAPVVRPVRPKGTTRQRRPRVRAKIRDRHSPVRRAHVRLRVDGRVVRGFRFNARRGVLAWRPSRALAPGRHRVRLVVTDALGNRRVKAWWFRVRR